MSNIPTTKKGLYQPNLYTDTTQWGMDINNWQPPSNSQKQSNNMGWLGVAQAGAGALTGALSFFDRKRRERDQHKRQKELMDIQQQNQMALNRQGQELSLDLWNKTNAEAQMKHLEAAGLNPGLMYQQGGPGGTTQGMSGGGAAGGNAPLGEPMDIAAIQASMKMAEELKLLRAQKERTDEEARKTGAEANVIEGTGMEEAGSRIALNMSAVGLNIAKEDEAHANVLVAGSNLAVNDQKISVMMSQEELNRAEAKFKEKGLDVQDSVIKLNKSLAYLNTAKAGEAIANTMVTKQDYDRLEKLGISRSDTVVAKTVEYLSEQTGLDTDTIIWGLGGVVGAEKLVALVGDVIKMRAPVRPATIKGYGK